ncbi:UDP-glycosyltransferase 71A16-like [Humulus lupulus]|uniref:UDP-glycosyltransferase 71A16-like n=1 Tax=Humulus lupulus TaxID=3486 RepID=UPI002B4083BA|nr:UDP-glycosyltransferase 71A16-like [Humulus lupulus]
MKKGELVFIPFPGVGHIVSSLEMAKHLVAQDLRLSISILLIKIPGFDSPNKSSMQSLGSISERIKFIELPEGQKADRSSNNSNPINFITSFFENLKPHVRHAVKNLIDSFFYQPDSPTLAGFVIDMFSTAMIDVADEFGVPSYVFFTSGAGFLRLMTHLESQCTHHNKDITEYKDQPDAELVVPGFVNPIPAKVFPDVLLDKVACPLILGQYKDMKKTKGFLVNTFMELESNMIDSMTEDKLIPPIYPVGPLVNLNPNRAHKGVGMTDDKETNIVTWLDSQPPSSVVFLCFGSMGSFNGEQVKEIAIGLEQSGVRFLWSLRKQPQKGESPEPKEFTDLNEVLPEGFLDRTAEVGKVIGWAPQVTVLAHPSVGGFVSHCGWNSTLESLWFGVPMATWPLYAEQQIKAFKLVKEYRLAVEIRLDYRRSYNSAGHVDNEAGIVIVKAEEIELGIRRMMEPDNDIRKRVKEMSDKGRKALLEGGSSYTYLCRFITDVIHNIPQM